VSQRPIVFREHGHVHRADTCRPVVEAVRAGALRLEALARGTYPGRRLPAHALPGVRSVGFWDARSPQDWGLPLHRNEGIELTFLESGRMPLRVDNRNAVMQPDQLLITRPWQPHQLGDPRIGAGRLAWLILDVGIRHPHQSWRWPEWLVLTPSDLAALTRYLRGNEQPLWPAPSEIRHGFQGICQAVQDNNVSKLAVTINELFLQLLELFRGRRVPVRSSLSSSRRSVELFLKQIADNLGEPWTLAAMAERCAVGPTTFVHHCRKLTNMAPIEYLTHLRVQAACRALRQQRDRAITDIALDCGFASSQYFANVFRRQVGCSPRAYRQDSKPSC